MNQSNWMIPDARESWVSLLYKESKIIENRRVLFAGDDFENIAFLKWRNSIDLLTYHCKTNDNESISIGFPIQRWPKNPEHLNFKHVFRNHLQQKVLDDFQCFFIQSKAEIVSSHEHLKSFNSTDSSLRYHPKFWGIHGFVKKNTDFVYI